MSVRSAAVRSFTVLAALAVLAPAQPREWA